MATYTLSITIERQFDNRANALSALDALEAKVPAGWTFKWNMQE